METFIIDLITRISAKSAHFCFLCTYTPPSLLFSDMNTKNMQNSTLINLINDDIKSITSERLSPITVQELELSSAASSDNEVCEVSETRFKNFLN